MLRIAGYYTGIQSGNLLLLPTSMNPDAPCQQRSGELAFAANIVATFTRPRLLRNRLMPLQLGAWEGGVSPPPKQQERGLQAASAQAVLLTEAIPNAIEMSGAEAA
jgi:hypothetical protein